MARLHLVSAEIGGSQPCLFRFEIGQQNGGTARIDLSVPGCRWNGEPLDIGRSYEAARAALIATLLEALIDADSLDDSLTPRQEQAQPNSETVLDLRRAVPANDDHRLRAFRAGGTS